MRGNDKDLEMGGKKKKGKGEDGRGRDKYLGPVSLKEQIMTVGCRR